MENICAGTHVRASCVKRSETKEAVNVWASILLFYFLYFIYCIKIALYGSGENKSKRGLGYKRTSSSSSQNGKRNIEKRYEKLHKRRQRSKEKPMSMKIDNMLCEKGKRVSK